MDERGTRAAASVQSATERSEALSAEERKERRNASPQVRRTVARNADSWRAFSFYGSLKPFLPFGKAKGRNGVRPSPHDHCGLITTPSHAPGENVPLTRTVPVLLTVPPVKLAPGAMARTPLLVNVPLFTIAPPG